jgi:hypothetical protein
MGVADRVVLAKYHPGVYLAAGAVASQDGLETSATFGRERQSRTLDQCLDGICGYDYRSNPTGILKHHSQVLNLALICQVNFSYLPNLPRQHPKNWLSHPRISCPLGSPTAS